MPGLPPVLDVAVLSDHGNRGMAERFLHHLLLTIYCHEEHNKRVSIPRVSELRIKIRNELAEILTDFKEQEECLNSS